MEEVHIATYAKRANAELARMKLEAWGLSGRVVDDSAQGENIAGFHLMVPSTEREEAMAVIEEAPEEYDGQEFDSPVVKRARTVYRVAIFGMATIFLLLLLVGLISLR